MWPRPIGLDSHSTRRWLPRPSGAGVGARRPRGTARSVVAGMVVSATSRPEGEVADEAIDLHRVAAEEPVAAAASKVTRRAPGIAATIFCAWE